MQVKFVALKAIQFCSVRSKGGRLYTSEIFFAVFCPLQSATRCLVTERLHNNSEFSTPTSVWYGNLKYSDPWQLLDLSFISA